MDLPEVLEMMFVRRHALLREADAEAALARAQAEVERRRGTISSPKPKRSRGRPRRWMPERAALVASLADHGGSVRAAARALHTPRSTFARRVAGIPSWAWAYGIGILERHAALLHRSGVTPEVARLRGYASVGGYRGRGSGLLVPLWTVHGHQSWTQVRLDRPSSRRNRFDNAPDACPVVDCPRAARPRVIDPAVPLYVTEGPRKADAAASRGMACVDFPGVRMMNLDDATWDYIGVSGREVRIVFDGDAAEKADVGACEWWLREYLAGKGARVSVLRLPADDGLDDYLACGGSLDALPRVELSTEPPHVDWSPGRVASRPVGRIRTPQPTPRSKRRAELEEKLAISIGWHKRLKDDLGALDEQEARDLTALNGGSPPQSRGP
jgi:hypothetical protein